ncbi:IS1 family transposase [Flaviaesturariibacter amylovorans]|uniref:IS1 family transposase n=2 Tax=Flaviaesturariibacter amylovorans TaxID=1084520 RepID=A0ABP8HTT7_9BACT
MNTISKTLIAVGTACKEFHDTHVVHVDAKRVECDEIWSFVYSKEKNVPEYMQQVGGAGSVWTWVGIDAQTKMVIDWHVGTREVGSAYAFMQGLAARLKSRVQLTTDGLKMYIEAVDFAFDGEIDYAQLVKQYGAYTQKKNQDMNTDAPNPERRYSPQKYAGAIKTIISGRPDADFISTSYIERQNLTMRMSMRRFTRLTNAFSKKLENHKHAISLYFVYYNFVRFHQTLKVTPAIKAKLARRIMSLDDLVRLAFPK